MSTYILLDNKNLVPQLILRYPNKKYWLLTSIKKSMIRVFLMFMIFPNYFVNFLFLSLK